MWTNGRKGRDYIVLNLGSASFKIGRLLFIALLCVHLFACAFYRVKKESALSQEDVDAFYEEKGVDPKVCEIFLNASLAVLLKRRHFFLQDLPKSYVRFAQLNWHPSSSAT